MKKLMTYWITLLAVFLMMTGCSSDNLNARDLNSNKNLTDYPLESYDMPEETETDVETCDSCNEIVDDLEVQEDLTLKDFLGKDYERLSPEFLTEAEGLYNAINEADDETYYDLMEDFNQRLRDHGIPMPYFTMTAFVEDHAEAFGENYEEVLENEAKLDAIYNVAWESGDYDTIDEDMVDHLMERSVPLFEQAGFDYDEVVGQIENQVIQLVLFKVSNGQIALDPASILKEDDIPQEAMAQYENIFDYVSRIIPAKYMQMITRFEINTDGTDNVLAHVIEEAEDMSQWRLAIDIRDAMDEGHFKEDLTETVIHELGHIITLNKSQMTDDPVHAYSTMEGQLSEASYLNLFYQTFWSDLQETYDAMVLEDPDEGIYNFYEAHEETFVSDYAASNPEEDIAESYRVFVLEDKPTGQSLQDEKVNFFYQFEELVAERQSIRKALGLESEQ